MLLLAARVGEAEVDESAAWKKGVASRSGWAGSAAHSRMATPAAPCSTKLMTVRRRWWAGTSSVRWSQAWRAIAGCHGVAVQQGGLVGAEVGQPQAGDPAFAVGVAVHQLRTLVQPRR
jgi:hypothetical protein